MTAAVATRAPRRTDADRARAVGPAGDGWETTLGAARPTRLSRLDDVHQHGVPLGPPPWMRDKSDLKALIALAARFEYITGIEAQVVEKLLWEVMPDTLCYPSPRPDTLRRQKKEWSVKRLAGEIGRHPRTWQKAVAHLRDRKLIRVYDRNADCGLENGYEILLDAWVNLGRSLLGDTALRDRGSPAAAPPARSLGPSMPKWAVTYARKLGRTAEQLVALTMGAIRSIFPTLKHDPGPRQLKDLGRRLMWLWRVLGTKVGVAEVIGTAQRIWAAACDSDHPLFRELRDEGGRRELKRPWGQDPLHDLRRALSRRTQLQEVIAAAEAFHQVGHKDATAPLILDGQAGAYPATADVVTLWQQLRERAAERLDPTTFAVWLGPLTALRVQDGALLLAVPDRYYLDWCSENYTELLNELGDGPVGFQVVPDTPEMLLPAGQGGHLSWSENELGDLWAVAKATVKERLDAQNFAIWIEPLAPLEVCEGTLVLGVPNRYYLDFCAEAYAELLSEAVGGPVGFVVAPEATERRHSGVDPPPPD